MNHQDDTHGQILPVSAACAPSVACQNAYGCLGSNQVSSFEYPRVFHLTFASRSATVEETQRPKGQDGALSSLDVAIEALNLAKETADIAPAKVAFGSVSVLLTTVRVCFLLFCGDGPQVHMYPGFNDQQTGLRRARIELCRYLQSP